MRHASSHRATGLLDEPLARFVTRLREGPDALLIVHQASSPDEHLSPATQDKLHLAEVTADHALGMAGVWLFGRRAMPIVGSCPGRPAGTSTSRRWVGGSALPGAIHVELADSCRQYRGHPLELLELNRIVLDRSTAAFADRPTTAIESRAASGSTRRRAYAQA
jgi:hypothetical protein